MQFTDFTRKVHVLSSHSVIKSNCFKIQNSACGNVSRAEFVWWNTWKSLQQPVYIFFITDDPRLGIWWLALFTGIPALKLDSAPWLSVLLESSPNVGHLKWISYWRWFFETLIFSTRQVNSQSNHSKEEFFCTLDCRQEY